MTRVVLRTKVNGYYTDVFQRFDKDLFNYLFPPSFIASLVYNEGSDPGNRVKVQFKIPYKSIMHVQITQKIVNDKRAYFIDEGLELPFGLKMWQHKHEVENCNNCSIIVDDITFSFGKPWLDALMKPLVIVAFAGRKPQYKKFFGACKN